MPTRNLNRPAAAIALVALLVNLGLMGWTRHRDEVQREQVQAAQAQAEQELARTVAAQQQGFNAAVVAHQQDKAVWRSKTLTGAMKPQPITLNPGYQFGVALKPDFVFAQGSHGWDGTLLTYQAQQRGMELSFYLTSGPGTSDGWNCIRELKKGTDSTGATSSLALFQSGIPPVSRTTKPHCDGNPARYRLHYRRPLDDGSGLSLDCWGMAPYGTPLGEKVAAELLAACHSVKVSRLEQLAKLRRSGKSTPNGSILPAARQKLLTPFGITDHKKRGLFMQTALSAKN